VVNVPEKDPADRRDYGQILTLTTQILASLVTVILVLKR
jgi:hypothetical protein